MGIDGGDEGLTTEPVADLLLNARYEVGSKLDLISSTGGDCTY